jgi:hypothetical protein
MCFWYRMLLLQYVFLVQNVVATVCVTGTERCCYSMCFWYRTLLMQYVFLVQNVVATVCDNVLYQKHILQQQHSVPETHTVATTFCTRNTYCSYRTLLLQYMFLVQKVVATICLSGTERCCCSICFWYRTLLLQ